MADLPKQPTASERAERLRAMELDGKSARAEYAAESARVEENTARLKALRLEKERAEAAAQVKLAAAKPAKSTKTKGTKALKAAPPPRKRKPAA